MLFIEDNEAGWKRDSEIAGASLLKPIVTGGWQTWQNPPPDFPGDGGVGQISPLSIRNLHGWLVATGQRFGSLNEEARVAKYRPS